MRHTGKCPKCGSENIQQNARVIQRDFRADIEIAVYENPEALVLRGEKARYTAGAWICMGCGFTELYCL